MKSSEQLDLSSLPKQAQNELLDFYLFLKQRYQKGKKTKIIDETALLSEKSLSEDWDNDEEDDAWQKFQ